MKEQCKVLFPYKALNDDELTLAEGQIVTIVTKDVEDKGWWKGEVDGKVGVFPDNFVELIESKQEAEVREGGEKRSRSRARPTALSACRACSACTRPLWTGWPEGIFFGEKVDLFGVADLTEKY